MNFSIFCVFFVSKGNLCLLISPNLLRGGHIDFAADTVGVGVGVGVGVDVGVTLSCLHNNLWTRDWSLTDFS